MRKLVEMNACKSNGLCCGAGVRKCLRKKKRNTRVNWERTKEAIDTGATIIAAACPFCNTMMTDALRK